MKNTTLIIVTYKSSHIVTNLLDTLYGKFPIKIIDNGSNDDLEEVLRKKYNKSRIEATFLENNIGFGRANNLGLENVNTKYSLILNPDLLIDEESITKLVECMENNPEAASCGPVEIKTKNPSKNDIELAVKKHEEAFGDHKDRGDLSEVPFLCGGFLMLRMGIVKKIGFFDKNIFLYYEDEELSKRIVKSGYKNLLVKGAICSHFESTSTKTKSRLESAIINFRRNWHIGWSKSYLKKKRFRSTAFSALFKILTSTTSLLKFRFAEFLSKFAKQLGILSYCIGMDCFNSNNRKVKIIKKISI